MKSKSTNILQSLVLAVQATEKTATYWDILNIWYQLKQIFKLKDSLVHNQILNYSQYLEGAAPSIGCLQAGKHFQAASS